MDTVKRVKSHDEDVVAADSGNWSSGEQMMKNDKVFDRIVFLKFGKFGDVNVQYDRAKVGPKSITSH